MTRIFNITYYEHGKSLYVRFYGCNFNCIFCINKKSIYDTHLPDYILKILEYREVEFLNLKDFEKLINEILNVFDINIVTLGGGEPTLDKNLPYVVKILKDYGLRIRLLTNAYLLNDYYVEKLLSYGFSHDDHVVVSIKAIDPVKHKLITGIDNSKILSNVKKMYNMKLNLIIETVYVPGLLTVNDIVNLAKWISKNLKSEITLIIDPYIPVPNLPFRKPKPEGLHNVVKSARKYLHNVMSRQLSTNIRFGGYVIHKGVKVGFNREILGNIHLIYPSINFA